MADKGICRLCGKEGTWERYLSRGHEGMMLKHYCPVKAKQRADKKKAEKDKQISETIKAGLENCWYGWHFGSDVQLIIVKRYPTKDDKGDDFFRTNWTTEDFAQLKKRENAVSAYQKKVFEYISEKRKYPTKRQMEKWANEV